MPSTLTATEQAELSHCEETIRRGWQSFVEVGEALTKIQEMKLYRDRYERFEDYYRAEWQYQKSQIYRLMRAAQLVKILSPIGEKRLLPCNESQVRPLLDLDEKQVKTVWEMVSREVGGDPKRITARLVQKQVRTIIPAKIEARRADKISPQESETAGNTIEDSLNALVALVPGEDRKKAKRLRAEILMLFKKLVG